MVHVVARPKHQRKANGVTHGSVTVQPKARRNPNSNWTRYYFKPLEGDAAKKGYYSSSDCLKPSMAHSIREVCTQISRIKGVLKFSVTIGGDDGNYILVKLDDDVSPEEVDKFVFDNLKMYFIALDS